MTDLQAALQKACEDAAKEYLQYPFAIAGFQHDLADIIEHHLTPVFEALRDSVERIKAQARLEEHKRVCRTCVNSLTSLCARGRELEAQANP